MGWTQTAGSETLPGAGSPVECEAELVKRSLAYVAAGQALLGAIDDYMKAVGDRRRTRLLNGFRKDLHCFLWRYLTDKERGEHDERD